MQNIRFDRPLNVRLPEGLKERLSAQAARKNQKVSEYCRAKLTAALELEEQAESPRFESRDARAS